jgi:hypothetical protein
VSMYTFLSSEPKIKKRCKYIRLDIGLDAPVKGGKVWLSGQLLPEIFESRRR